MLARAARRKIRRDVFHQTNSAFEQLTLPWLCPAQMRWAASTRTTPTSPSFEARKQKVQSLLQSRHENRTLATSADTLPSRYADFPVDSLMPRPWASSSHDHAAVDLPPWDPSQPLIIHRNLASAAPTTRTIKGIPGDATELHQNLYACLKIGRMDRAAAIVQRLANIYQPHAPEVLHAHNAYLQGLFELAQSPGSDISMGEISRWFHKELLQKGVEPDGTTLVIMLRASMNLLQGAKRSESIREYLDLVNSFGPGVFEYVNSSPDFTEDEWETLIRAQPEAFEEPDASNSVEDGVFISTPAGREIALKHGLIEEPVPSVKPVEQKGLGLQALQAALAGSESGKVPFPEEMPGTPEEKAQAHAYLRQLKLEDSSINAAIERWRQEDAKLKEMDVHVVLQSRPMRAYMWQWYTALLPLVQKELEEVRKVLAHPERANKSEPRLIYGPYLELATPKQLTALTIQCVILATATRSKASSSSSTFLRTSVISNDIGTYLHREVIKSLQEKQRAEDRKRRKLARLQSLNKLTKGDTVFKGSQDVAADAGRVVEEYNRKQWPQHVRVRIGSLLLEKLVNCATVDVTRTEPRTGKTITITQPAFSISSAFYQGKSAWILTPHYELHAKLRTEPLVHVNSMLLPMLAQPKPWTGFQEGGYYTRNEPVIRVRSMDDTQRAYAISAIEKGDMDTVLSGLDVLGKVPWQINKDVYRVMLEAWNKGLDVGGLVPEHLPLERPEQPPENMPWQERSNHLRKLKAYENEKSGLHSQKCFQNFQLEIGRAFLHETFYYPHNVDFRGRAYPIPPLLNHMGSDLPRGMLRFANGKELGIVGLQWLKIHLANLYGYDKASLKEREVFTMEHIQEIYDSATNPLTGRRWWAKAEDPWQCLACCMELKNALDSADPTRFVSHLPVHQDGTCNGLQHYAALGGDKAGATQVNLEPSDRPQDIYTGVAELVKESVVEDAKNGHGIAQLLKDKITRKVVKRTVMTNVYGVTFQGARMQVLDELKPLLPNFEGSPQCPNILYAASYVASKIFFALGKIFNGARDIQDWLGQCCSRITTSITPEQIQSIHDHFKGDVNPYGPEFRAPQTLAKKSKETVAKESENRWLFKSGVIWTTPLKMPVVQPYRKTKPEHIKTSLQIFSIEKPRVTDEVSQRKQLQAFPPNFIHSLDASHMLLSALKCDEEGVTFAAVHDSFWTHAADIPKLNVILRDAFVRMHSEDIIGRLAAEFEARYSGFMYRATVKQSSPTAKKIMAWRVKTWKAKKTVKYHAPYAEVAMEVERQALLKSDNAEDRKKGAAMVTPTSIFDSIQDSSALDTSAKPVLLGQKPAATLQSGLGAKEADVETRPEDEDIVNDDVVEEDEDTVNDDVVEEDEADAEEQEDAAAEPVTAKKTSNRVSGIVEVWLPLTFPPVPAKGDWDVRRLKESKYFFS